MKQTLLYTLSFFTFATLMTACSTGQIADEMAVVGNPSLSSDPCTAIDEKVLKLDRFTEVVKQTSAFHLEEKANALSTPGITVSNNRRQMLKDAQKKYAEYTAERKKYGCKTPLNTGQNTEKLAILDSCTAIDNKVMQLDRFTEVVKHTSAFYLEEKAVAIEVPGITVSNNRRQMLKDAQRKYVEYTAEYQKHGCKNTISKDKISIAYEAPVSSVVDTEPVRSSEGTTVKVKSINNVAVKESASAVAVTQTTTENSDQIVKVEEKQDTKVSKEPQELNIETPMAEVAMQTDEKKTVTQKPVYSSEKCDSLDEELMELSKFTDMVKNTSAFHLEEKASALPSPGFTVSNNKKKMLRDIEKRYAELLAERKKYGCEAL